MTNLKQKRLDAGMTQAQVAEAAGISLRSLQDFEQGRHPINKAAAITVYKLATALGCEVKDILEIED